MKIYIDFSKQAITKVTSQTAYEGDFESIVFELLFFNYNNTNWYPTMSQLAPNGREAGDFTADEAGTEIVEDGITYLKFEFTLGTGWVSIKGISNFFIWNNQFVNGTLTKKCIGKITLRLNESTNGYFVFDPYLNPSVAAFMRELMEGVAHPAGVYTNEEIGDLTEDIGIVVSSTDGYWYYFDIDTGEYVQGALYQAPFYSSENKLDADYVDDTNSTHKFVTASEKTLIASIPNKANKSGDITVDFFAKEYRGFNITANRNNNGAIDMASYFSIAYNKILYRPYLSNEVYTYTYPTKNGVLALTSDVEATGHSIALAINTTNYQMTAILKDANGNTISTSNVIDLPLESVVVSGAYDDATKKVILTLENGSTIEFSVADLISGLQTEITAQNKLSSDLVDDTGHTNKFVSASEKAQITTNANAISGIKDGASIDSFADVEAALGNKADLNNTSQSITANIIQARTSISVGAVTGTGLIGIVKDANSDNFQLTHYKSGLGTHTINIPIDNGTMALTKDIDNAIKDLKWELGSHTLDVANDNDTAYEKQVPNGTIGCQINSIGGMSYKSENLLQINDVAETTTNGVTYKVENGVVTFSGVADTTFNIALTISFSFVSGTSYTHCQFQNFPSGLSSNLGVSGSAIDGSNQSFKYSRTFSVTGTTTSVTMYYTILSGTDVNGLVCKPMVVNGTTAPTEFKIGFDGIRDSAVSDVKSYGANLLQLNDIAETTTNGITYKIENGVLILNGTSNTSIIISSAITNSFSVTSSMALKWFAENAPTADYVIGLGQFYYNYYNGTNGSSNKSNQSTGNAIVIDLRTTVTFNNAKFKPMVVKGTTQPTTFSAYSGLLETLSIPSQIQNLTGYGWGVNDTCYNYIDFDRKVFVQKVGRADLGVFSWNYTSADNLSRFYIGLNNAKTPTSNDQLGNILLENYKNNTWNAFINETLGKNMAASLRSDGALGIRDLRYTDVASFKSAMNGVYLYYELATPVVTDISAYLTTDTIEVESLGTLDFTNTYSQDVPSDIDYLTEVAD